MTSNSIDLQHCDECDKIYFPALERCPAAGEHQLALKPSAGTGALYSYTVTHVAMSPLAKDKVPYSTVIVELDEGPRVVAHWSSKSVPLLDSPVTVIKQTRDDDTFCPLGALIAQPTDDKA